MKAALPQPICGAGLGASVLRCRPLTAPGGISHHQPGASVQAGQQSLLEGAPGAHRLPLPLLQQNPAGGERILQATVGICLLPPLATTPRADGLGRLARGSGVAQTSAGANLPSPDTSPSPSCGRSGDAVGPGGRGAGLQCPASHGGTPGKRCCPRPPPCEGQAAGERWGVTQTGKLAGTQPFPAGTGERHTGSCSGPELGTLAAAMGTPKD